MSIFNVLENKIIKSKDDFSEYLSDKKGDILRGSEFMFFALTNIFKDKDIEEIEKGMFDSSYRGEKYDFGIDAIYITGSNEIIENPEELEEFNDESKFKIQLFQFKRGNGIGQDDLLKLKTGISKILIEENISEEDNLYLYNRMSNLNEIKSRLFSEFNTKNIEVQVHIVFGGIESNIHSEKILNEKGYTNSNIIITDCEKLINATSTSNQIIDIIEYEKTFKYITDTESKTKLNGYISIINGKDIAELVRKHQSAIFEANIRDYFKRSDLNSKILETSSSVNEAKYFWSYNNGLTMTCSKVDEMPNNKYKLHNLQIVNGCQTSNAIYLSVKNRERVEELNDKISKGEELTKKETDELELKSKLQFNNDTSLLVKIIETKDDDFIYKITETTNSQTPIKAFSLKANDDSQKLIEKYFEDNNVNYERRINSLKNKGKKNICSIQKLFQLYTSQILLKPSQVKTRPKSMFVSTYDDVFPSKDVKLLNYLLYLVPVKIDLYLNKAIKEYLKENPTADNYIKTLISYGKLHLGCFLLSSIVKKDYSDKGIITNEKLIFGQLDNNLAFHFEDALSNFEKIVKNYAGTKKESIPSAVRKNELDQRIARFVKTRK
jgi:hypothetical protein